MDAMDMEILARPLDFAGMVFCRFDRFTGHWKRSDQPLVIGLSFQVGGCRRLRSEDAVVDRQPYEHDATTDGIECSPPETTDGFEHQVVDLPDDRRTRCARGRGATDLRAGNGSPIHSPLARVRDRISLEGWSIGYSGSK
jgi:hypothetical protein